MIRRLQPLSWFAVGTAAICVAIGAAAGYSVNGSSGDGMTFTSGTAAKPAAISPQEAERATNSAKDLSIAFRVVADRVLPAVVAVEAAPQTVPAADKADPRGRQPFGSQNPFEGTPFEDFFRQMPQGREFRFEVPPQRPQPHGGGVGSGVIIDPSGVVLTNNHVVSGGGQVTVRLSDGREFPAASIWTDPQTDIAVVKIEGATDLVAAKIGNSDAVAVGDWVLALGQPFGLERSVTAGIISALHRGIGITSRENFLQTDAAINPGNSGGPLVNLDGEVVGINTAISSRSGGNDGIGFAVPINQASWVAQQLVKDGTVQRAYLGVGIQPVSAALAEQFRVKPHEGVVVTEVYPETPAARAGLQSGDVIRAYAGTAVSTPQELQSAVEQSEIGQRQKLSVLREGKPMELQFTPEKLPSELGTVGSGVESPTRPDSSRFEKLGMELNALDAAVAEQLGRENIAGVVVTDVQSGSPADRAGLESGMVITQVNRQPVKSLADVKRAIDSGDNDKSVLLLVRTSAGSRFVVVKP